MNICIDVGNTTIMVGIFKEDTLIKQLMFTTDLVKTSDEYQNIINKELGKIKDFKIEDVRTICFSSVVPQINNSLKEGLTKVFPEAKFLFVSPGIKTGVAIKVDNPLEIGSDLIADLVAAKKYYGYPSLIIDLGTASKILLIDKNGYFASALIIPGLILSANSLSNKAALLPNISIEAPKTVIAKNTIDAMKCGITYGHVEMICGLVKRIEKEIGYSCKHILTGGASNLLKDLFDESYIVDDNLLLKGLNEIINRNEINK